jgi:hypothetical protein
VGLRWSLASPLSTRHVEELMEERGVEMDHSTLHRWVVKYSPLLEEAFHRRKRLERVMHVECSARCMDRAMKRRSGVRRDPDPGAAWIPACAGMTTTLRVQYGDAPEYITRSSVLSYQ